MKISGECANLELDCVINPPGGSTQQSDITVTYNINFRQLLGDMYGRYDEFMIVFDGIGGWSNATSYNTTNSVLTPSGYPAISGVNATGSWSLGMIGLDWKYYSYNGNLSNIGLFPNKFNLGVSGYTTTNFGTTNQGLVFRKPQNGNIQLTISPYLTRTQGTCVAVTTGANIMVDFNYNFSIYGLSNE